MALLLLIPASASAWRRPSATAKPFYDSRTATRAAVERGAQSLAAARPSAATVRARADLRRQLGPEAVVNIDPLTGTPRQLMRTDGALSGPRAGARETIALDFVRSNRAALGLSSADVDGLVLSQKVTTPRGLTVVHFQQVFDGIPAFDNDVRVAIDRAGRVGSVAGAPRHDLSVASTDPAISGTDAYAALQRNVDVRRTVPVRSGPAGVRKETKFANGDFARLVLFGGANGARLAWHVLYRANSHAMYDAVVDADSGAILYRQSLTKDVADAEVYANHPGADPAVTVNLEDLGLPGGSQTLDGDFSHAWSDINDDNVAQGTEEVGPSAGTDFIYPFTDFNAAHPGGCTAPLPCAWDPDVRNSWQTNREQNAVQAFYLVSTFHDHLAGNEIAFTDDSGNFEKGGTGGDDPVLTQTDDGADTDGAGGPDPNHSNNANMSTPPDGESPTMQMYLFTDTQDADALDFRNMNGGDDSGVVWHEYTHGLSNRLVTNADGSGAVSTPQAGAMGEAWSDWYASDNQVRLGMKTDAIGTPGEIDVGEYSDRDPHTLRSQPLDCPVDVADAACPGAIGNPPGGYTYGSFGKVFGIPEVHADGEIWSETLWDLRQALQVQLGSADDASDIAEILVTDAMRVSPPEPSYLDMRNSILTADELDFGGPFHDLIWSVFRKRGMGYFAAAADGADFQPIEDFTRPPDPNAPTGSVTGHVIDAGTGLPAAGVLVEFGGHASRPGFDEFFADTTDANGEYTISGVPVGTYPKLAFQPSAGFNQVIARNVQITQDGTAVRDAAMVRDWSSTSGGANIVSVSDDTGAGANCGAAAALDQSQGTAWSAFNPTSADPGNPHAGPPTMTIELPETINIDEFLINPTAGCGDGGSASTRQFRIETSADGTTFATAFNGVGAGNEFTDADERQINEVVPTGAAQNVKFVRLTLLNPMHQGADPFCQPNGCSGTDFIDMTEFEVIGGHTNVLPSGSLSVPATATVGNPVTFTANFTDPDSAITGYGWDFDGNGTVDRTTTAATTTFAYSSTGTFAPKVTANDFRGGGTTAAGSIKITAVPPAVPPIPTVAIPKTGSHGAISVPVSCSARCSISASLVISKSLRRKLGLHSRTVAHKGATTSSTRTVRLTLSKKVKRALKRKHLKSLKGVLTVRATYEDGRRRLTSRRVTIRL